LRQEQIFRLVHHDFGGLSQTGAAQQLGISQSAISNALAKCQKVMPQMFPILTKLELSCYKLHIGKKWEIDAIAKYLDRSENTVYKALHRARDKGIHWPLLTKLEEEYYQLYTVKGWSVHEIAEHLNKSQATVYEGLKRARNEGMSCLEAKGKLLSYNDSMDAHIKSINFNLGQFAVAHRDHYNNRNGTDGNGTGHF